MRAALGRAGRRGVLTARLCEGLPPYGPQALSFPEGWTHVGHEGVVVEFHTGQGAWHGNFEPGMVNGPTRVWIDAPHAMAYVMSRGDLWRVDAQQRTATRLACDVVQLLDIPGESEWIAVSYDTISRVGRDGVIWETRRLSWDGFEALRIEGDAVVGMACSPEDMLYPLRVQLSMGECEGGSYPRELG